MTDDITYVQYAEGKRPLKLAPYVISDEWSASYLTRIIEFVVVNANKPKYLAQMEPAKFWALIERLATLFCRAESPTKNYGLTKAEIRGAIYFTIAGALKAGCTDEWPLEFPIDDDSFVILGGDQP